jgi:hypothetical protein
MPLVRPRVDGQPMRAGLERYAPKPGDARPWQIAAVAEQRDGIQIDGQLGRHRLSSKIDRKPIMPFGGTDRPFRLFQ